MRRRARSFVAPWLVVAAVVIGVLVAGCGSDDGEDAAASLEGEAWILESGPAPLDAPGEAPPTATFAEGAVSGFSGCNTYRGSYELDGDQITIGPLASTLMACPEPAMGIETAYLGALEAATTWSIDGSELSLGDLSFTAGE